MLSGVVGGGWFRVLGRDGLFPRMAWVPSSAVGGGWHGSVGDGWRRMMSGDWLRGW